MHEIPERDWKALRRLAPRALNGFCERALEEVLRAARKPGAKAHDRYLAVWDVLRERDAERGAAFDDMRRSRAYLAIFAMRSLGLIGPDDLSLFSDETRALIAQYDENERSGR